MNAQKTMKCPEKRSKMLKTKGAAKCLVAPFGK